MAALLMVTEPAILGNWIPSSLLAMDYVRKTPVQVWTSYRQAIEKAFDLTEKSGCNG